VGATRQFFRLFDELVPLSMGIGKEVAAIEILRPISRSSYSYCAGIVTYRNEKRFLPLREYTNSSAESRNLGRLMIIRYGFTFLYMLVPEALDA
jgi:hypothetical protein